MSDAQFKLAMNNIVSEINANKELLTEVRADGKAVFETIQTIYQRIEDMSKKFDEVLNAGIKKPRTDESGDHMKKADVVKKPRATAKKATSEVNEADDTESSSAPAPTPAKKKPVTKSRTSNATGESKSDGGKVVNNIMTYFKTKYLENSTAFNDILDEKQAENAFAEPKNAADIESKKAGITREKAKAMALYKSTTKDQKKKIRDRIINDQEAANINNDADVEEAPESD